MRIKAIGLALMLSMWTSAQATELRIDDAWISEPPPGMAMLAGYLTIRNDGDTPVTVTAIRSSAAEVMMHETQIVDGTAKMRHLDSVTVPAKGSVAFEPGGRHLMIMGAPALKAGDRLPLEVVVDGGEAIALEAEVRREGE